MEPVQLEYGVYNPPRLKPISTIKILIREKKEYKCPRLTESSKGDTLVAGRY